MVISRWSEWLLRRGAILTSDTQTKRDEIFAAQLEDQIQLTTHPILQALTDPVLQSLKEYARQVVHSEARIPAQSLSDLRAERGMPDLQDAGSVYHQLRSPAVFHECREEHPRFPETAPDWQAVHELLQRACAKCRKCAAKMKTCSSCQVVQYCSTTCQKEHWCKHKDECGSISIANCKLFDKAGACYSRSKSTSCPKFKQLLLARAAGIFQSAAEKGHNKAKELWAITISEMCNHGKQGMEHEIALLEKAAAAGSSTANIDLGHAFFNGLGVKQDCERAAGLYKFVLDQNRRSSSWRELGPMLAQAEWGLAVCYFEGKSVTQDLVKATTLGEASLSREYMQPAAAPALCGFGEALFSHMCGGVWREEWNIV